MLNKLKIISLLLTAIQQNPELRFCQLLHIITYRIAKEKISNDIFYITDFEIIKELKIFNEK